MAKKNRMKKDKTLNIMIDRIMFLFQLALSIGIAICMTALFIVHGLLADPHSVAITVLTAIMAALGLWGVRYAFREYRDYRDNNN